MGSLEGEGVRVDLPPGWEGRLRSERSTGEDPANRSLGAAPDGEPRRVIVHAANFPLPPSVADFGAGAVEAMTNRDVFVVIFEYGRESAGTALFASDRVPRLAAADFSPAGLRRTLPGQSGAQRFFSLDGRAFCAYVVLGSHTRRFRTLPMVNELFASFQVG